MFRLRRWELFTPDKKAFVHVVNRKVRRCFLFGDDELSRRNDDYRKDWTALRMEYVAGTLNSSPIRDLLCRKIYPSDSPSHSAYSAPLRFILCS